MNGAVWDKSLKPSEVLPKFFVPFVSSCSHLRPKPLGLLLNSMR